MYFLINNTLEECSAEQCHDAAAFHDHPGLCAQFVALKAQALFRENKDPLYTVGRFKDIFFPAVMVFAMPGDTADFLHSSTFLIRVSAFVG